MPCHFIFAGSFQQDLEVALAQYPSLNTTLSYLQKQLEENPHMGGQVGDGIYTVPVMVQEANNSKEKLLYVLAYVFAINF